MARPLRIEFGGALYHLTGRGNARGTIFLDQRDCAKFVQFLVDSLERYDIALHAFVLMGNHYHLIAETRQANLGQWMHWLTTTYTVYFNRRHRCVGHLFQGRYKSIVVEAEGYLLTLSRYVHLNPVRGRVIGKGTPAERRKRLRGWGWSSYAAYSGLAKGQAWLSQERILGYMGDRKGERPLSYRRFVEEGLLREIENPLDAVSWQTVLGGEHFLQRVKDRLASRKEHRELPALRQLRRRPDVQSILEGVAKVYRCSKEQLLERGRKGNEARAVAMVLIWDCCGMRLREIGALFGGAAYTAVAQMIARTKEKDRRSKLKFKLNKLMDKCGK